jgi:hypothetical protein
VFFQRGAIFEISRLLKIWKDPKTNNIMYRKDMLRDWSSPHLLDCGWYLDYPNENTLSLEFGIRDKHEPRFLQGVSLGEGNTNQEEIGGGARGRERKKI